MKNKNSLFEFEDRFKVFSLCHSSPTGILIETHEGLYRTRHSTVSIGPTVFSTETRGELDRSRNPSDVLCVPDCPSGAFIETHEGSNRVMGEHSGSDMFTSDSLATRITKDDENNKAEQLPDALHRCCLDGISKNVGLCPTSNFPPTQVVDLWSAQKPMGPSRFEEAPCLFDIDADLWSVKKSMGPPRCGEAPFFVDTDFWSFRLDGIQKNVGHCPASNFPPIEIVDLWSAQKMRWSPQLEGTPCRLNIDFWSFCLDGKQMNAGHSPASNFPPTHVADIWSGKKIGGFLRFDVNPSLVNIDPCSISDFFRYHMNADLWSASNFDNALHKIRLCNLQENAAGCAASSFSRHAEYLLQRKSMRRQRERLRAKGEADKLDHAICEHDHILRRTLYDLGRDGDGLVCCSLCDSRIYGRLVCDGHEHLLHWGCANALADSLGKSHWDCHNPFIRKVSSKDRIQTSPNGHPLLHLPKNMSIGVLAIRFITFWLVFSDQQIITTLPFISMDQDDEMESKTIDPETHSGEFQPESTRLPPYKQNRDESNAPAEWLLWPKTRDEIFGVGSSVWDENWAFHFKFDRDAAAKQLYLWDTLSAGKHYQFGMGF